MNRLFKDKMFQYLLVLTICATVGLQAWRILFDNFSVTEIHLDGYHVGVLQSVREIPGFLALFVVYVLFLIKEHRIAALSVLVLGIGVAITGLFPSFYGLLFTTLMMSFGFHYFETTNQSLTLQYFDRNTAPLVFGKLRSYAALSNIVVGVAFLVVSPFLNFTQLYLLFGGIIALASLWAFFQTPDGKETTPQKKSMVVKKQYWLFYCLTFMAGARRQIFIAFAVFLLVKKFNFSIQEIAFLFLLNNLINYFLSPLIGKWIIRFGERKVLSLEYFSLVLIFVSYALVESKEIAAVLYILDHIFFNFAIAIRTFFQKIADPQDIAPSMAVGFTINHIAAVILPAIGGLLWIVDYRIPFFAGAFLSLTSLIMVQLIDKHVLQYNHECP